MKTIFLTLLCCCITPILAAQSPVIQQKNNFVTFDNPQKLNTQNFLQSHRQVLDLQEGETLVYQATQMDDLGYLHHRYQFAYKGIPVEGAIYVFHEEGGILSHVNGYHPRHNHHKFNTWPSNIQSVKNLGRNAALNHALNHINAKRYAWEDPQVEVWLKEQRHDKDASFLPRGELLLALDRHDQYRLAYRFEIMSLEPMTRQEVYIEAQTGDFIKAYDKIYTLDEMGSGNTSFYGNHSFHCKHQGGQYVLAQGTRNIETLDATYFFPFIPWSAPDPFTSNNKNNWSDPAAVDVHWGAEQWYDYFQNRFGWQSYNDNGAKITSLVHKGYNNAAWNGFWMSFGDGNQNEYNTWTSIDMVAHELTHAFIENTAGLRYWGESGALNEALADIFGTIIEHEALGSNANWLIGEEITKNGEGIRSMEYPEEFNDPSQYLGQYWYTGNNDHGGVHSNSGVANHWFYLLAEGGSYNIGINNAADIVFRATRYYFTPYSQYYDARNVTLQAAKDLFGANSTEATAVCEAWNDVNVLGACAISQNISFTFPTSSDTLIISNTIPLTWNSSNDFSSVSLDVSTDGGNSWFPIFSASPNNGIYNWTIPNIPTSQARLRIRNTDNAAIEDITEDFTIAACDAEASFAGDTYACFGSTLSFTNTSTNATTTEWLLDGISLGNSTNLTHTFADTGNYQLELRAGNGDCYSTAFREILVVDSTNVADFAYEANGSMVTFSSIGDDTEATYSWDFGDGNTSTGRTTTHTYGADSLYQVCLEVGNACGSFTKCNNVIVSSVGSLNTDFCQFEFFPYGGDLSGASLIRDSIFYTWSNFWGGPYRKNVITNEYTSINSPNFGHLSHPFYEVWEDTQGNTWISRVGGIIEKYGVDGSWTTYTHPYLQNKIVYDFAEDLLGYIWIATNSGVIVFDGVSYWIASFTSSNSDLPHNIVYDLKADLEGNIWFATRDGIAKYDITNYALLYSGIFLISTYTTSNSNLPDNYVRSITEDLQGDMWFSTNGGLVKLDSTTFTIFSSSNLGLPTTNINVLDIDNRGNLWYSTNNDILVRFDGQSNWEEYPLSPDPDDCTTTIGLTFIGKDAHNAIWVLAGGGDARFVPNITPKFDEQDSICTNNSISFINQSLESIEYEWFINNQKVSEAENLTHFFQNSGEYKVTLSARNFQCSEILEKTFVIPAYASELNLPPYATICNNESTSLDAQLYTYATYEWSYQNDSIGNQAIITVAQTGDYILSVIDSCGNSASDTISVIFDEDCVWPGDINKDSIVNNKDLLFLGLAHDATGAKRFGATLDFIGQAAEPFSGAFRDSTNYKHADCNGDSIINAIDKEALVQNYDRQRGTPPDKISPSTTSPITLLPIIKNVQRQGDTIDLDLSVALYRTDGGQTNFYGLAFTARYDSPILNWMIVQNGLTPDYTLLGADVIDIRHQDSLHTDIAFTGTNHVNRTITNQQGDIGNPKDILTWVIGTADVLCGGGDSIYVTVVLDDILLMNSVGDTLPVSTEPVSVFITPDIILETNTTSSTCSNYGTASVTPLDTTQSYQYLWSNNATTASISGLLPNSYGITVTSATDTAVTSVAVGGIAPLVTNAIIQQPSTCAANGAINLFPSGGSGNNYTIRWSNGQTGPSITGLEADTYVASIDDGGGCSESFAFNLYGNDVPLNLKVFLEGAYDVGTGLMTSNLVTQGSLPLLDPYLGRDSIASSLLLAQGSDALVEWVLIELRDAIDNPIFTTPALLQSDGDVVGIDGCSLPLVPLGDYYVVIHHSNHLSAMSAQPVPLHNNSDLLDFTQYPAFGTNGTKLLSNGYYVLHGGDATGDGSIDSADRSATWNARNQVGYLDADCNLNGTVGASDRNMTWNNRNNQTQVP